MCNSVVIVSLYTAALGVVYGFVVGWWMCALVLVYFCLSTCCVHLEETAAESEFLAGRGILRCLSG